MTARLATRKGLDNRAVASLGALALGLISVVLIPVRTAFGFAGMVLVGTVLFGLVAAFGVAVTLCAASDRRRRRRSG